MKHKFNYLFTILIVVISISCEKNEEVKPLPEPGYPSTYKVLSQTEWDAVNAEFKKVNVYDGLTINKYGFMNGDFFHNENLSITPELLIEKIDEVIGNNKSFIGISEEASINAENDVRGRTNGGVNTGIRLYFSAEMERGKTNHYFSLNQKTINEKNMEGAEIRIVVNTSENKIGISGNWFQYAMVPKNQIYLQNEALDLSLKHIRENKDKNYKVSEENIHVDITFVAVPFDRNIELHECWYIIFRDIHYKLFIDTQTGEILKVFDYSNHI